MPFSRPTLGPGAHLRLVAPSSPFPVDDFERGVERLRTRYQVSFDETIVTRAGYLAGDDRRRARELQAAIDARDVDAIVAARGGYGTTRLLPRLDFTALATRPKALAGFSDITALHAQWARAHVGSLHGNMVAGLGRAEPALFERWVRAFEGELPAPLGGLRGITSGRAAGTLVGGNLAVLCALFGTPFALALEDAVLFLEDVGERPYRVDRMLTTLLQGGFFRGARALVLGHFEKADPGPDGVSVEDVLQERLGGLGIPVVAGVPAGHVEDNLELPFGATVVVDGQLGEMSFEVP